MIRDETLKVCIKGRTVSVRFEPTTDKDFRHFQTEGHRWMFMECEETGRKSRQICSTDISVSTILHYAHKLVVDPPVPPRDQLTALPADASKRPWPTPRPVRGLRRRPHYTPGEADLS